MRMAWLIPILLACHPGPPAGAEPATRMLADFEAGKAPFSGGRLERGTPIAGRASLRVNRRYASLDERQDWSGFDYLRLDVYNPQPHPARFLVEIRDADSEGYWSRVNFHTVAPPGTSTVTLSTTHYTGEKSRPGRPLKPGAVTALILNVFDHGPLLFDNIRLERTGPAGGAGQADILAWDYGPPDTPLMPGFERGPVHKKRPDRRAGWMRGGDKKPYDCLQPDPLTRDLIFTGYDTFRIDLENGRYLAAFSIEFPGGYWGEVQKYRERVVRANGVAVVSNRMDAAAFRSWYFRHADREDRPGMDVFAEYIDPLIDSQIVPVTVTNGHLDLSFSGQDWTPSLSYLAVAPAEQKMAFEAFLETSRTRRREHFRNHFRQVPPPRSGADAPAAGYRLFHRPFMAAVHAQDGPRAGETLPPDGLSITAARGEERPLTLALQPGEPLGPIALRLSAFTNQSGASLPASSLQPGWIDYRISRHNLSGSIFSVRPRYWHPLPAPDAPGLTRRFWLRLRVPEDQEPGTYRGTLTVAPARAPATDVPVTIRALPFVLHPIDDVPVGPWGSGIPLPWFRGAPATAAWEQDLFHKTLAALREVGATSLSGRPRVRASFEDGAVTLHTRPADREMALLRQHGFTRLISSYGIRNIGYDLYRGLDDATARTHGFPDAMAALRTLYTALDDHAASNRWARVAWTLCDEPGGARLRRAIRVAEQHRTISVGLDHHTFMGATALTGADPDDPHLRLARALNLAVLNPHDQDAVEAIRGAGNAFGFYNGGNRWTLGRYMKMLVDDWDLALRLTWHYNNNAGDPYYALDSREDDYSWYNSNADGELVPSMTLLREVLPGYNDYRLFRTLQVRLQSAPETPARRAARELYDDLLDLTPGEDRSPRTRTPGEYLDVRNQLIDAILSLEP